jgi:ankyrin repeat protein
MQMPMNLTDSEIAQIQERYSYLTNYDADDPDCPIDLLTYVDSNGDHLLHIAAQRGDVATVQLLIRAGVDVNQLGDMGCTALHYARMKGHDDVAALLLVNGASETLLNQFGKPP